MTIEEMIQVSKDVIEDFSDRDTYIELSCAGLLAQYMHERAENDIEIAYAIGIKILLELFCEEIDRTEGIGKINITEDKLREFVCR